jgi:BirA family biotin operon repressor/biotin-[acetyl-CoA-carboxylase] ligase
LARKTVAARIHDQTVEPGPELGLAAELAEPGAQLDERLLRGVPRFLEVAHELRSQPVHARRMPLDECVESPSVAVSRFADEVHVAEPPVRENPPDRRFLLGLTDGRGGWLHGVSSVVRRMADALTSAAVEPLLQGRFGRPFLYQETCESTQRLLEGSLGEGAVAVCDEQTAGRGRLGRSWSAPAGTAILVSVLLVPPAGRAIAELSLVGGVATAEAVEAATGLDAEIKWPNDVLLDGRKVAGVLAEASEGAVVLGIGLNVNQEHDQLPANTAPPAASLQTATGRRRERAPVLADLLLRLERAYDLWRNASLGALHPGLQARDFLRGRRLVVDGERAFGIGIERDGLLEVEIAGERRLVESGEVLLS